MSSQRYTPEFKDEAVRQVLDRGYPLPMSPSDSACRLIACTSG